MKKRAIWFLLLAAALGAAFWFSGSISATEKKVVSARDKNVVITKHEITLPGTTVSKEDADAMNKILNQYDKTLFRIDTYDNGKRTKTRGNLTDLVTDKRLTSEMAAAINEGFSQYAIQIGFDNNPTLSPTPKSKWSPPPGATTNPANTSPVPGASTNPTSSNQNRTTTKELFDRLKQILKKYQRK